MSAIPACPPGPHSDSEASVYSSHHNRSSAFHNASSSLASSSTMPDSDHRGSISLNSSQEFLVDPNGHPLDYDLQQQWASSSSSTPIPSRSNSPLPRFFSSTPSSAYASETESEPSTSPFARSRRKGWWTDDSSDSWIGMRNIRRRRRRRKSTVPGFRSCKRVCGSILVFIVSHPISILLALLFLSIFAILLTLLLIHILQPDKEPLPWRLYCSIPTTSTAPPSLNASAAFSPTYPFNSLAPTDLLTLSSIMSQPFPPPRLEEFPPAGVFLGVFSMDSAVERRMLVRTTWANHDRSRNGAGDGDGGRGTSRSVVRFILGRPRSSWVERIKLEAEMYNDIVILPISENMNSGKTHAFFSWASTEAWVPPLGEDDAVNPLRRQLSYSNVTANHSIPLAKHDPIASREEWRLTGEQKPWVRPDFAMKVDDDSFVMLAEIEARLRVELHTRTRHYPDDVAKHASERSSLYHKTAAQSAEPVKQSISTSSDALPSPFNEKMSVSEQHRIPARPNHPESDAPSPIDDPLVYWGYLVKNQFMAGEFYGLSWSLVEWAARDQQVKGMTTGKEDKQVSKWMRVHPRKEEVRWKSERCWIYDHPRAGTVYSHGFLFPSEASRVRQGILSSLSSPPSLMMDDADSPNPTPTLSDVSTNFRSPARWAYSSVSTFGVRYDPPISGLTTKEEIEGLVEGSAMSLLKEGGEYSSRVAWTQREGRRTRYESQRVGGTVVVHFIKRNPWFLETALALLEGVEVTDRESKEQLSNP